VREGIAPLPQASRGIRRGGRWEWWEEAPIKG